MIVICELMAHDTYCRHNGYLFNSSIYAFLSVHGGNCFVERCMRVFNGSFCSIRLMLHEHFYWHSMKHEMCIYFILGAFLVCKKVKLNLKACLFSLAWFVHESYFRATQDQTWPWYISFLLFFYRFSKMTCFINWHKHDDAFPISNFFFKAIWYTKIHRFW